MTIYLVNIRGRTNGAIGDYFMLPNKFYINAENVDQAKLIFWDEIAVPDLYVLYQDLLPFFAPNPPSPPSDLPLKKWVKKG